MRNYTLMILICLTLIFSIPILAADKRHGEETGTLILADDFNRDEATPNKEDKYLNDYR